MKKQLLNVPNIEKFLEGFFTLPPKKKRFAGPTNIEETYTELTSSRWRNSALPQPAAEQIRSHVIKSWNEKKPIQLTLFFGGYKQAQLPSYPRTEWAELLHIRYFTQFASALEEICPFGVKMLWRSDREIMTYLSNYPQADLIRYEHDFKQLISLFQSHIPSNRKIELAYKKGTDDFTTEQLIEKISESMDHCREYYESLSPEKQRKEMLNAYRNIHWNGAVDLSKLSTKEKESYAVEKSLIHHAFLHADRDLGKEDYAAGINVSFIKHSKNIHYSTCEGYIVKFWVGEGFLKETSHKVVPVILSFDQIQKQMQKNKRKESWKEYRVPESLNTASSLPFSPFPSKIGVISENET
jgi:hypothetical protein